MTTGLVIDVPNSTIANQIRVRMMGYVWKLAIILIANAQMDIRAICANKTHAIRIRVAKEFALSLQQVTFATARQVNIMENRAISQIALRLTVALMVHQR
jgi:hypothetical protein